MGGLPHGQIARLNVDGSPDLTFSYCGCHLSGVANAALQPDGKFLVGGGDANNKAKLIRPDSDGSLERFLQSGFTHHPGRHIRCICLGGAARRQKLCRSGTEFINGRFYKYLHRVNADGTFDGAFTTLTVINNAISGGMVPDVVPAPDGKFYLGTQEGVGQGTTGPVRRYSSNGSLIFHSKGRYSPGLRDLPHISPGWRQPDGNLIISGKFDTVNGAATPNIARVFPAGNVDLSFQRQGQRHQSGPPLSSAGAERY